MGYDDDECLICYLFHGSNSPCNETHYVCVRCVEFEMTDNRRVLIVLGNSIAGRDTCVVCDKFCNLGFNVRVCGSCCGSRMSDSESE